MLEKSYLSQFSDVPGVYLFYDQQDLPLYIGKSIKIKSRLLSHFRAIETDEKEREIFARAKEIKIIPTAGELGALLRESYLVKKLQPLFNVKLRRKKTLVGLFLRKNITGHNEINLEEVVTPSLLIPDLLVLCSSKRDAQELLLKICHTSRLCPKLCGVEKSNKSCFWYQLSKCNGACLGKESPESYNNRFDKAFAPIRYVQWPFDSTVEYTEHTHKLKEKFVINNWKAISSTQKLGLPAPTEDFWLQPSLDYFDSDEYKILRRALFSEDGIDKMKYTISP